MAQLAHDLASHKRLKAQSRKQTYMIAPLKYFPEQAATRTEQEMVFMYSGGNHSRLLLRGFAKLSLEPAQAPSIYSILQHKVPQPNYELRKEPPPGARFTPAIRVCSMDPFSHSGRGNKQPTTFSLHTIPQISILSHCSAASFPHWEVWPSLVNPSAEAVQYAWSP